MTRTSPSLVALSLALALGAAGCGRTADPLAPSNAAAPSAAPGAPQSYSFPSGALTITITDLGTVPGGLSAMAYGINNLGQATGVAADAGFAYKPVVWDAGAVTVLSGYDPSGQDTPVAIGDDRTVAGYVDIGKGGVLGNYWNPAGQVFGLAGLPGGMANSSKPKDVNATGLIAGITQEGSPTFYGHAVVWQNGAIATDLGFQGSGHYSEARGVNDLGHVCGIADDGTGNGAFLWKDGVYTRLGGGGTGAEAVNNADVVAGFSQGGIAVQWVNGVMQTLPALPGRTTFNTVTDLSNTGDVVGYGMSAKDTQTAGILWRNGVAYELPRWPGGEFAQAEAVNDHGQIVGWGNTGPGSYVRAFLWTVTDGGGNTPPTVSLAATSPTTINAGGSVSFKGTFSDPDSPSPWSYNWAWGNGSTTGTATAPGDILATRKYTKRGTYSVKLSVRDTAGATGASNAVTVKVR